MWEPRYSGPGKCGVCKCGHSWDEHHIGFVMNPDYIKETGEACIPEECEAYGCNEAGLLDSLCAVHTQPI